MRAHCEITGALLRIYFDNEAQDRDAPDFIMFVVGHEGLAIVKGLITTAGRALPLAAWPAARKELLRLGFTEICWTRYGDDGEKIKDFRKTL